MVANFLVSHVLSLKKSKHGVGCAGSMGRGLTSSSPIYQVPVPRCHQPGLRCIVTMGQASIVRSPRHETRESAGAWDMGQWNQQKLAKTGYLEVFIAAETLQMFVFNQFHRNERIETCQRNS